MIPAQRGEESQDTMYYENHPAYVNQRLGIEGNFKDKYNEIERQFHDFRQQVAPKEPTKKWVGDALAHTEDGSVHIISNWASFDVLQYPDRPAAAGMSMVHLLAIPQARIVNGLDLTNDNVGIIDDMINLFEKNWEDPKMRKLVLRDQWDAIERQAAKTKGQPFAAQAHEAARAHYEQLVEMIDSLKAEDFHYGLHLRPDNSADYLHLHIIAAPWKCRKYSTSAHDKKTKDAREVRDFIRDDARRRNSTGSKRSSISDEGSIRPTVAPL